MPVVGFSFPLVATRALSPSLAGSVASVQR